MRRRHAAQTSVAALAALLLLAVWQVPQWLDWTRYRSTIEMLATAALGQPVTIRGPISLALLPQPVLTASKVDVGDRAPASLSFHVEALRLRVALMPLLGGHVDAQELVLRGPDLRIPWGDPEQLRHRPPAWLAGFAARIEDGRLTIGQVALTGVDATLATLDTGALTAAGTVRFNGLAWHFTSRLTTAGPDGAAGLNLTIDGQEKAVGLGASFTGQLAQDGTLAAIAAARLETFGVKQVVLWAANAQCAVFAANKAAWSAWTPEQRDAARDSAIEAARELPALVRAEQDAAQSELSQRGVTVTRLTAAGRAAFAAAARSTYDKWAARIDPELLQASEAAVTRPR